MILVQLDRSVIPGHPSVAQERCSRVLVRVVIENLADHAVVKHAEVLNVHPAGFVQVCVLEQGVEDGAQER